jgi:hypothetical protein
MTETTYYTKLYDWIAQKTELSLLEKMIICNVLRFQKKGCYESYRTIGRKFGVTHSYIIKAVKSLIGKEWLCVLYEGKYKRILYVVPERLKAGPLWEQHGYYRDHPGLKTPQSGHHRDHVVKNVSYNESKREERIINSTSEVMRQENKMSISAKEKRRQELIKQFEDMK